MRLAELTKIFLRAGNLTFGGGAPTIALLHHELVEKRSAITNEQYATCFALSRITPGTNVLAFSAAVAYLMRGWPGAFLAVAASSIPSAVVVVLFTRIAADGDNYPLLKSMIEALIAAVIGLIAFNVYQLARPSWKAGERVLVIVVIGLSAAATTIGLLPPLAILGLAALYGAFTKT